MTNSIYHEELIVIEIDSMVRQNTFLCLCVMYHYSTNSNCALHWWVEYFLFVRFLTFLKKMKPMVKSSRYLHTSELIKLIWQWCSLISFHQIQKILFLQIAINSFIHWSCNCCTSKTPIYSPTFPQICNIRLRETRTIVF